MLEDASANKVWVTELLTVSNEEMLAHLTILCPFLLLAVRTYCTSVIWKDVGVVIMIIPSDPKQVFIFFSIIYEQSNISLVRIKKFRNSDTRNKLENGKLKLSIGSWELDSSFQVDLPKQHLTLSHWYFVTFAKILLLD